MADKGAYKFFLSGVISIILMETFILTAINVIIPKILNQNELSTSAIIWYIIMLVISSLIIGLLYCGAYETYHDKLPGSTDLKKALILSIIFWFISSVLLGYISNIFKPYDLIISMLKTLIIWLLIGIIIEELWKKFGPISLK
jgi:hypothetical protein